LTKRFALTIAASLALAVIAQAQTPERQNPATIPASAASELADLLSRRVADSLRAKVVVGKPVIVGAVTLVPVLMIDVNFGGAGLLAPSGPQSGAPKPAVPQTPPPGADGFLMTGEARPVGFIVVSKQGTRFIGVAPASAK